MGILKKAEEFPARTYVDPFSAFRGEMDRMFENFLGHRSGLPELTSVAGPFGAGMVVPSMDIKESDEAFMLTAELPGLDEKDIVLSLANGVLTLKGEKKYEHEDRQEDVHVMERRYGSFLRRFHLPDTVDHDTVDASFDKGVLTVTLKKRPETKTPERKIEIGK